MDCGNTVAVLHQVQTTPANSRAARFEKALQCLSPDLQIILFDLREPRLLLLGSALISEQV
jgi:hypothetical protein